MKIAILLFLAALLAVPAIAEPEQQSPPDEQDKPTEIGQLVQCLAVDITLAHLHNQIAASMIALSGPIGKQKLSTLIKGYTQIAANDKKKAEALTKVAKEALIPELRSYGIPKENIKSSIDKLINQSLDDIASTLSNPDFTIEDQVAMEKALNDESGRCEAFGQKVLMKHTY